MGTEPYQPLTMISDFEESKFYVISLDMTGLRVLNVKFDLEWAMLVVGSIANDRMFYVLDNFFLGNITDKALVMSLSALRLGKQYVAITEKACKHVKIEAEVELSQLERIFLRDLSESNRVKHVHEVSGARESTARHRQRP